MTERIAHAEDYPTSRRILMTEAVERGAVTESHLHPLDGPAGEELATDVARFGASIGQARVVIVLASGTHGVEGHGGWGIQRLVMGGGLVDHLPSDVAVLMIHGVNPFGMAWSRRVDHENVDVNRNFIDFGSQLPRNDLYDEFSEQLNPRGSEFDPDDSSWQQELWAKAAEIGMAETFRSISGGQYHVADGVQFGGNRPTWSSRTLGDIWARHLADTDLVMNLDLHTGLGSLGALTIFQTADEMDPSAVLAGEFFPNLLRSDRPETTDPMMVGVLGPAMEAAVTQRALEDRASDDLASDDQAYADEASEDRAPGTRSYGAPVVVPLVVEFGTYDSARVLSSMRADNWLHHHGDPRSALGARIRAEMRETFFIDDDAWREQVASQGIGTVLAALEAAEQSNT